MDEKSKKLAFVDTGCFDQKPIIFLILGVGMSREELVDLLGTIAKSGSKSYRMEEKSTAESIIGQNKFQL